MPLNDNVVKANVVVEYRLNPCSNGMPLNVNKKMKKINFVRVSILVLMECL